MSDGDSIGHPDDEGPDDGGEADDRRGGGGHEHGELLAWHVAADRVRRLRETALRRQGTETVSLAEIGGRTLAEPLRAPTALPERSFATMDGFAFDASDDYPLSVLDAEVYPEDDPPEIEQGEAVRIATGAPLPRAADVVLKREEATVEGGSLEGAAVESGTYVYERGSNVGMDEQLFEPGERLGPGDALLLGDLGLDAVTVRERFSVGLLATGTEIHEGRHRDLDSPMLAGLVEAWDHDAVHEGTVPDAYERVEARIAALADAHDVVVTTGGTSVGEKDHVVRVLANLGEVLFHRVALRPGKPIAVAELPDHDAVAFAVPGKPVGAYVVAALVARPFFTGDASLPTVDAEFARDVDIAVGGFTYAIPVTLEDGTALPLGHADSALTVYEDTFDPSVLSSSTRATRTDGFVLTETALAAGESVRVVPVSVLER